jgi:uncharacterized delta-60 repeat protein
MVGRGVTVFALMCALGVVASARATVAPGRVTFPLGSTARHPDVDPFGLSVGVALPGGGVVLAGIDRTRSLVLSQLLADGSLDPTFGGGGISRIGAPSVVPQLLQLLRRPDGRLLIVAATPRANKYELDRVIVIALRADGALDSTYGGGGVAAPGIQWSCANCSPATLTPGGGLVVTGNTGEVPPTIEHDPSVVPDFHWVAARLTPTGSLDAGFGQQGIASLPGADGMGYATVSLPGDAVAVLGRDVTGPKLAQLTATGAPNAMFNGGAPITVSGAFPWLLRGHTDGSVDVLDSGQGATVLTRYTSTGAPDRTFGTTGTVALPGGAGFAELIPALDGGDIVARPLSLGPAQHPPVLRAARVTPGGVVAAAADVSIPFGGGLATVFAVHRAPIVGSVNQTDFFPGRPFARADGSLVLPGALGVVQYTGEGAGYEIDQAAVAALTPSFTLDRSFGGPAPPATISIRVPHQRASTDANVRLLRVVVNARTSGPGLCLLRVTAGHRVIAHSTAPVFSAGQQRLRALLTKVGRRYLRHAHRVRVTITATFRDLLASDANAHAKGTLF